jgi:hypothetical protein
LSQIALPVHSVICDNSASNHKSRDHGHGSSHIRSPNLAAAIGYYGAARAFFYHSVAHGQKIDFVKNTRIAVETTPRKSPAVKPNDLGFGEGDLLLGDLLAPAAEFVDDVGCLAPGGGLPMRMAVARVSAVTNAP